MFFFLVTLLISSTQLKPIEADELLKHEKEIVAWLDKLGYQDLSQASVVNVTIGNESQVGDQPEGNSGIIGFLVAEDGADFTVVDLSGNQVTFSTKENATAFEAASFERLDLKQVVRERLEAEQKGGADDLFDRVNIIKSEPFETVFLARACVSQGLTKEAHELFELANRQQEERNRFLKALRRQQEKRNRKEADSLIDFLKKDQAYTRLSRAITHFGSPEMSRLKLLVKFEDITENFPESEPAEHARKISDLLKKMLIEDKLHAAKNVPPLDELEGEALVAELIYQLRTQNEWIYDLPSRNGKAAQVIYHLKTQNVKQWGQPKGAIGKPDSRKEESPAERLASIGLAAVPQLIEVIDDQRFTRSLGFGFHPDFCFTHDIWRVGDCAERILCRIAGRNLYQRTYTNDAVANDGQASSIKKEVEAWWKEVETKGEEQVLIEAVISGDDNAAYQAFVLMKKYPDSAVDAIRKGLANSRQQSNSQRMLSLLADHGSDEAEQVVRQQLIKGKKLPIRVTAAHVLMEIGRPQLAIERMLYEWKNCSPDKGEDYSFDASQELVAAFLIQAGSSEAVKSVAEKFSDFPALAKFKVISSLSDTGLNLDQKYNEAVEAFLVESLQVTEDVSMNGQYGDQSFSNLRVCDIAGYVLTKKWPESYSCRLDRTERERDADRFTAINDWRNAKGLKPVKVPKPFVVLPSDITDPLVEQIVSNESHDGSQKALEQLAKLGLSAIAAVKELSSSLEDSHPNAKQVRQLALDLPNIISVISVDNKSVTVSKAWLTKIDQLKGQTFSGEMLSSLLVDFVKQQPCPGIRVKAIRDGNDNGVELFVEWIGKPAKRKGIQQKWNRRENFILGRETLEDSVGSSSLEHAAKSSTYVDLKKSVNKSLARPDQLMRVVVSLIVDD